MRSHFTFLAYTFALFSMAGFFQPENALGQSALNTSFSGSKKVDQTEEATPQHSSSSTSCDSNCSCDGGAINVGEGLPCGVGNGRGLFSRGRLFGSRAVAADCGCGTDSGCDREVAGCDGGSLGGPVQACGSNLRGRLFGGAGASDCGCGTHSGCDSEGAGCDGGVVGGPVQGCGSNLRGRLFGGGVGCGCGAGSASNCGSIFSRGGCGCDDSTNLRSRMSLENPISRGPAPGVNRFTRGTFCHGGCDGCTDCRGGLFSNVGQNAGWTGRFGGGDTRLGGRWFNGGACDDCGTGGLGSRISARLGAMTGFRSAGGLGVGVADGGRFRAGDGFVADAGSGLRVADGSGTGAGLIGRLRAGDRIVSNSGAVPIDGSVGGTGHRYRFGDGLGTDTETGLGFHSADRFAAHGGPGIFSGLGRGRFGEDGDDCGSGLAGRLSGPGILAGLGQGRLGGDGADGVSGLAGPHGGLGAGAAGLGCGGLHCGGRGCHGGCGLLHGVGGCSGPTRGQIPHTAQPDYGAGGIGGGMGMGAGMGQQAPTYAYPYYTTRGPRDFLQDNPPTIGW